MGFKRRSPRWMNRLMRPVYFVGGGMTSFRKEHEMRMEELVIQAARMAVLENNLNVDGVKDFKRLLNFAVYGHFAPHFADQLLSAARVHAALGLNPLGNVEVTTGGATGGAAIFTAVNMIASGYADCVLVGGWEMMDEVSTKQGNDYIAHAADKDFEYQHSRSYTNYYALMAQRYMFEYPWVRRTTLSEVSVKNHSYARYNPFSQAPAEYAVDEVGNSGIVAEPLRFLDCCLMSTGAAVAILASEKMARYLTDRPVEIDGIGFGTDTLRTGDRRARPVLLLPHEAPELYREFHDWPGFSSFMATRYAAWVAYQMAGVEDPLRHFDLAETHDAFTISALQSYEDLGFRPYGQGADFIESGDAYFGGRLPENLSGGLIGTMHAVGATGIMQVIEVGWQLQGKWAQFHADPKIWERCGRTMPKDMQNLQVPDAHRGVAVSHAGTGSHVTVITLRRRWE